MYWYGNAAKARVVAALLRERPITILDHGCGDGGDWPSVLEDNPGISLVAWDPDLRAAREAQARLEGFDAQVSIGRFPRVQVDVVVSFSVLEHVRDKKSYLRQARSALPEGGRFFLNYDDGHFRTPFDLDTPREAWNNLKVSVHNTLARFGYRYQRRVRPEFIDRLVSDEGFHIESVTYENVSALKWLAKQLPRERQALFAEFWLDVEAQLNEQFSVALPTPMRGDRAALWQIAPSRTLALRVSAPASD